MNEVSRTTDYIINAFSADTLVNTIAFEKSIEMDLNKENLYPLVNIDILSSTITNNSVNINYTISVVEARDKDNELNNDKLLGSNLIDNLNECHSIASRFISVLQAQNNDDLIEIDDLTDITFLKLYNWLDGVRFNIRLSIPKQMPSC